MDEEKKKPQAKKEGSGSTRAPINKGRNSADWRNCIAYSGLPTMSRAFLKENARNLHKIKRQTAHTQLVAGALSRNSRIPG